MESCEQSFSEWGPSRPVIDGSNQRLHGVLFEQVICGKLQSPNFIRILAPYFALRAVEARGPWRNGKHCIQQRKGPHALRSRRPPRPRDAPMFTRSLL
jgi:hypothetical protein